MGRKYLKGKKRKGGGCPLVRRMGPTRAGDLPPGRRTPHMGIVAHGGAKKVVTPPSPVYRGAPMPCLTHIIPPSSPTLSGVPIWELRTRREVSL